MVVISDLNTENFCPSKLVVWGFTPNIHSSISLRASYTALLFISALLCHHEVVTFKPLPSGEDIVLFSLTVDEETFFFKFFSLNITLAEVVELGRCGVDFLLGERDLVGIPSKSLTCSILIIVAKLLRLLVR